MIYAVEIIRPSLYISFVLLVYIYYKASEQRCARTIFTGNDTNSSIIFMHRGLVILFKHNVLNTRISVRTVYQAPVFSGK